MLDLLLVPGASSIALALAGCLIAAVGLLRLERTRAVIQGIRTLPTRWGMAGRFALGALAGAPLAGLVALFALASGARGTQRSLLLGMATALYLAVGVVLPRRPLIAAQRARRQLRQLTPGLVSYVRVALAGYDPPAILLERYCARPARRLAPMQQVVTEALQLMRERRLRPFAALRSAARVRGCLEFTDVAEALAQAEAEGSDVQQILAAQASTLEALLRDEFSRMLKRRTLYLLGLVAVALVVGILGNLLFVMTGGGSLLMDSGL